MNNDLISREALKNAVEKRIWYIAPAYDEIMSIIDNAPAVEPEKVLFANVTFDEDKLKDLVQTEVIDKIKSGELVIKDERPQGKWGKWVISEIQCPNCFEYFQTDCYSTEELKKCPNCGADMKGGAE